MSFKVLRYGNRINVTNPINQEVTDMTDVVFVEEGRSGGDPNMSGSSKFLSDAVGAPTGLDQLRTHTQPVRTDQLHLFPIDKIFQGSINRSMYSFPQIRQQNGVPARMVQGRPTYFLTWLDTTPKEDEDHRLSNTDLIKVDPNAFANAVVGSAAVQVTEFRGTSGSGFNQGANQPGAQALETSNLGEKGDNRSRQS